MLYSYYIRLIPQGTVDNNLLGPDRLAGPKSLDPNYCRQPILTVHGTELRLFGARVLPPTHTINVAYLT